MALGILFNISTGSLRQAVVPNHMLGRILTIAGVLAWSANPVARLPAAPDRLDARRCAGLRGHWRSRGADSVLLLVLAPGARRALPAGPGASRDLTGEGQGAQRRDAEHQQQERPGPRAYA